MLCPYCRFEYTLEQPCACHPAAEKDEFRKPEEPLWMSRGELPMALGIDVIPTKRS